jgi:hypothetical protein
LDPSGSAIGSLTSANAFVQIDTGAGNRQYASQTEAGGIKTFGSGGISFEFTWSRASAETDTGIVYAIGLWSNGDSTRLGDAQGLDTLRLIPCPVRRTGDVNMSGAVTSADVISMINFIFRGGPEPLPCEGAADVNCDARVTAADVIHMVNVLFKVANPCDVCPLIWDGTWTCE